MKRAIFILTIIFFRTIVSSQTVQIPDTIEVKIKKIEFVTKDTVLNGFIVYDTFGIINSFASQQRLDDYIKSQKGWINYFNHEIFGSGNYVRLFKLLNETDTIYSYRNNEIMYYNNNNLKTDNRGKPLLEHDMEYSYILNKMKQNFDRRFIYCLFKKVDYSVLLKVNFNQDTSSNFFVYRYNHKSLSKHSILEDSVRICLKKINREKFLLANIDKLKKLNLNSYEYSSNNYYEDIYVLFLDGKIFIVGNNLMYDKKVEDWVYMVESVSIRLLQLKDKFLKINYK